MQEDGEEVPTREADVLERLRDAETKHEGLVANLANIGLPFIPVEIKSMRMLRTLNLRGNALTRSCRPSCATACACSRG